VWDFVGGVVLSTADEKEAPFLAKTGQRVNLPSGSADITQIGRREAPWGLAALLFICGRGFAGFGSRNLVDFAGLGRYIRGFEGMIWCVDVLGNYEMEERLLVTRN